ncbi:MAG: TVP38/TMEM64 family protein [Syntrophales bacterium]|nr:TVP38/TMEM64 family protein [Syntrophales bacterium]
MNKEKAILFIESFHPFDEVVFILLQIIQVVAAPIPGEATGFIGGYLYGPILGTLYSTIGLTIGSWLAFLLARFFGMPLVERAVNPKAILKFNHFMEHQGAWASFLLFLIPGFPKDYLCYIMGVSHMPTGTFLAISTVGRFLGTLMLSVCGSCARNDQYLELIIILVASSVLGIVAYAYRDQWLEKLKGKKSPDQKG